MQPFLASFAGTAVEFFETTVIAYAIARAGYPREALSALVLGHAAVFAFAVLLVPIQDVLPVEWLRLLAACLLTTMGAYWSLKSLRRLRAHQRPRWVEDPLGKLGVAPAAVAQAFSPWVFLVMAKSSVIEASEILLVAFPIAAATGAWPQVLAGVVAGIIGVAAVAWALHGRLKRIPEVKLKLACGLVLTALGVLWLVETWRDYAS